MGRRSKRPQPLPATRKQHEYLPIPPGGIIAGFPEFWQKAHDAYPHFFRATDHLVPIVNDLLRRPIGGQLPRILHYMTAIISNSLGSLITLALNGYGHDAVRIARGMFETSVNAGYLAKNPTEVGNYLDYHWIKQQKLLEYMRKEDPTNFQRLTQSDIDDIDREYARVAPQFKDSKGRVRKEWSVKNLRERAEAVGMGPLYPTFYSMASSIHHGDFSGLASQVSGGAFRPQIAPSLHAVKNALIMGHQSVLVIISNFNDIGEFGMAPRNSESV
jgi:hypothetical protein